MRPTKELFREWHRFQAGELTRPGLERVLTPIRQKIDALWLRGVSSGNPR